MILSNLEIQKALDEGRLVIDPEPSPRELKPGVKYCPYDTTAVDLKLHNEISVPKGGTFAYDLTKPGSVSDFLARNSKKLILTEDQPFPLEPCQFILGKTFEKIGLPLDKGSPYFAARIEGKSSRARCGVLVHFTAPTVHAGWNGPLTLEMINLGPTTFMLRPEMPIAQLIVEEVKGQLIQNPSQFQNQTTPEGLVS